MEFTSSVVLTVSDGVDNEEGVTESESDDSEAQEIAEHDSDKDCDVTVEERLPLHTRRLATQTVNAQRQEGPRLKHRQKKHDSMKVV